MPKWIHDRAMSLKPEMEKTYGPEKAEQVAFAVATQQAHRTGKSPKTFKSKVTGKKERFGTPAGRREAKQKFDKPLKEYQKTAEAAMDTILETNETQTTPGEQGQINPQPSDLTPDVVNDVPGTIQETNDHHKAKFREVAGILDNVGEKPTFQREHVVKNPMADKPDTPAIKVSSDIMWASFFEELQKIAHAKVSAAIDPADLKTLAERLKGLPAHAKGQAGALLGPKRSMKPGMMQWPSRLAGEGIVARPVLSV